MFGRVAVCLSLIASAALIVGVLLVGRDLSSELRDPQSLVLSVLVIAGCSWPWLRAYRVAKKPGATPGAIHFSIAATAAAGTASYASTQVPPEGVGYNIILFLLFTWLVCPLFLRVRTPQPSV